MVGPVYIKSGPNCHSRVRPYSPPLKALTTTLPACRLEYHKTFCPTLRSRAGIWGMVVHKRRHQEGTEGHRHAKKTNRRWWPPSPNISKASCGSDGFKSTENRGLIQGQADRSGSAVGAGVLMGPGGGRGANGPRARMSGSLPRPSPPPTRKGYLLLKLPGSFGGG
jgi:hypothetical protein